MPGPVTMGWIIAVTEPHQVSDELDQAIAEARWRSWEAGAGVMIVSYILVAGLVKRGSDTIARQQAALQQQVRDLSCLFD